MHFGLLYSLVNCKGSSELLMKVDIIECIGCGDGFRDRTEECDDGNMIDGDGCSGRDSVILGYKKLCSIETHLGLFWCEPKTAGPRRGNALGDCLNRAERATGTSVGGEHITKSPQKRYYAEKHYSDRGSISTGGYSSGILPLCDGVSFGGGSVVVFFIFYIIIIYITKFSNFLRYSFYFLYAYIYKFLTSGCM